MKRNHIMRTSAIVLALVLATACLVSGTFAKYVTSGTADDAARVAKWGVTLTMDDNALFDDRYASDAGFGYDSVISLGGETDVVVAPGTKNDEGITFRIDGQPEVVTDFDIVFDGIQDVVLPAGTYLDYTTANDTTDTFTLTEDYYPVVYTLKHTYGATSNSFAVAGTYSNRYSHTDDGSVEVFTGTLADIEALLEAASQGGMQGIYADHLYNDEITLTWAWDFEQADVTLMDKADTYLGNVIAGIVTEPNNASVNLAFGLTMTVTQVD